MEYGNCLEGVGLSISSMTGYARAEGREGATTWLWEAKSVNGRGLDVRVRVPSGFDALESVAREMATRFLKRGNVQISLVLTHQNATGNTRINGPFLAHLLTVADKLKDLYPHVAPPSWDGLMAIKGVIEQSSDNEPAAASQHLESMTQALAQMLQSLAHMRQDEGGRIAQVLKGQVDDIERFSLKSQALASLQPAAQKERLRSQVMALLDASPSLS
jgi:uncharacterized protein (TIGR00255 family)